MIHNILPFSFNPFVTGTLHNEVLAMINKVLLLNSVPWRYFYQEVHPIEFNGSKYLKITSLGLVSVCITALFDSSTFDVAEAMNYFYAILPFIFRIITLLNDNTNMLFLPASHFLKVR